MKKQASLLLILFTIIHLFSTTIAAYADSECLIPESGPWPPCATGNNSAPVAPDECTIPETGPWPPCAAAGNTSSTPSDECIIPENGPWPLCARYPEEQSPSTSTTDWDNILHHFWQLSENWGPNGETRTVFEPHGSEQRAVSLSTNGSQIRFWNGCRGLVTTVETTPTTLLLKRPFLQTANTPCDNWLTNYGLSITYALEHATLWQVDGKKLTITHPQGRLVFQRN